MSGLREDSKIAVVIISQANIWYKKSAEGQADICVIKINLQTLVI